jgi:hypothetical protein
MLSLIENNSQSEIFLMRKGQIMKYLTEGVKFSYGTASGGYIQTCKKRLIG